MAAPKNPNTAAATAAVVRGGQETMARKLRDAGWVCIPPEDAEPFYSAAAGDADELHGDTTGAPR